MTKLNLYDHEIVQKTPEKYKELTCRTRSILSAWQDSPFSLELLDITGSIKPENDMNRQTLQSYINACEAIKRHEAISKPILGIGIMDNLEIGTGREIVAAAFNSGVDYIEVHVRVSQEEDVKKILNL